MKKIIAIILAFIFTFSLTGCGTEETVQVNVSNNESLASLHLGEFNYISDGLVYDIATRVVYIRNRTSDHYWVYTPYYAPNGLPYRYNVETNTFEEINN